MDWFRAFPTGQQAAVALLALACEDLPEEPEEPDAPPDPRSAEALFYFACCDAYRDGAVDEAEADVLVGLRRFLHLPAPRAVRLAGFARRDVLAGTLEEGFRLTPARACTVASRVFEHAFPRATRRREVLQLLASSLKGRGEGPEGAADASASQPPPRPRRPQGAPAPVAPRPLACFSEGAEAGGVWLSKRCLEGLALVVIAALFFLMQRWHMVRAGRSFYLMLGLLGGWGTLLVLGRERLEGALRRVLSWCEGLVDPALRAARMAADYALATIILAQLAMLFLG